MFLSDELIGIGRTANPKSNLSMAEQAKEIVKRARESVGPKGALGYKSVEGVNCTLMHVISVLKREGYDYGKFITFIKNDDPTVGK